MDVRDGPWRRLRAKELMFSNCGAGEDSYESLEQKEIKLVNPYGNQPWIFIAKPNAEAEAPILWPPDAKNWLICKDPDAGKVDIRRRNQEKWTTEDEIVGWYHWLNGHEFEQTPGDGEGQGSLACCSLRGCKESDTTRWLNNNNMYIWTMNSHWHTQLQSNSIGFTLVFFFL